MGTAHTPRHRLERQRPLLADLRRRAALVVVGSDLYADDLVLRAESDAEESAGARNTAGEAALVPATA